MTTTATRSGMALLIVLGTLVVATSALVGLAHTAASARSARQRASDGLMCDDLLDAAERPMQAWLLARRWASCTTSGQPAARAWSSA
jgi:hypothetical protein